MKNWSLIGVQAVAVGLLVTVGIAARDNAPAIPSTESAATQPGAPDPRKLEIARTAEAFVKAYEAGDAKALAAFWTEDGDYTDIDGRVLKGRAAIEADFVQLFKSNKDLKIHIHIESARFPTADTAIEDGTTSVVGPAGTLPSRARYSNLLVKKDGKWLLSSVREAPYTPPSNRDKLSPLAWVIGEWADAAGDGKAPQIARAVFDWTPEGNYIFSVRGVQVGDRVLDTGSQRIGWDPVAKTIRSWNFEADGGFGESVWTQTDAKTWTVKTTSVIVSGHKSTWTGVLTIVDPNTITWQMKEQTVDGKPVPDGAVVTMKRVG